MTRKDFVAQLEKRGFIKAGDNIWKMAEQPPEPWARVGARVHADRYDSLVFFNAGGIGVSERGLRFEQTRVLFSVPAK